MNKHKNISAKDDQKTFLVIFVVAILLTIIFVLWPKGTVSHQLSQRAEFAECLSTKGVAMYGSDTCENCQLQKGMFQEDFRRIHYINCDIYQDECKEKGIQSYPTWIYNNVRNVGVQTFPQLAQLSSCTAP